jgi:hypothetical protein
LKFDFGIQQDPRTCVFSEPGDAQQSIIRVGAFNAFGYCGCVVTGKLCKYGTPQTATVTRSGRLLLLEFCVQSSTHHRTERCGNQASAMLFWTSLTVGTNHGGETLRGQTISDQVKRVFFNLPPTSSSVFQVKEVLLFF